MYIQAENKQFSICKASCYEFVKSLEQSDTYLVQGFLRPEHFGLKRVSTMKFNLKKYCLTLCHVFLSCAGGRVAVFDVTVIQLVEFSRRLKGLMALTLAAQWTNGVPVHQTYFLLLYGVLQTRHFVCRFEVAKSSLLSNIYIFLK